MQWSKPDFQEITLNMEVTAYVNTEGDIRKPQEKPVIHEVRGTANQENSPGRTGDK